MHSHAWFAGARLCRVGELVYIKIHLDTSVNIVVSMVVNPMDSDVQSQSLRNCAKDDKNKDVLATVVRSNH